jgi:integrase
MPTKRLTEEGVRKLKPPTSQQVHDYFDAIVPGLLLRVNYGGRKTWRALHYLKRMSKDGKRTTIPTSITLGHYPQLTLKEARDKARQFLADPHKARSHAETGSFRSVAENFLKRHVEANKLRSQDEIERCLHKYIYPAPTTAPGQRWQDRPFRELKRGAVAALLDRIEDRHGPRQADMCLAIISKLTRWFQARDNDYISPVVPGMRRSQASDRKRKRILADEEIRALFKIAKDTPGSFGPILQLLLLTGQRREKVATMKWEDVVDGDWHIASEAREKSHAGTLPLPSPALALIEAQPRLAGNPYVFASGAGKHFNSWSQRKQELDEKLKLAPWVLHDLRRSARSLMSRAGVRPDIAERVLGHAKPGVEGVYDRHSYRDEKGAALRQLAELIEAICPPPGKKAA